MDEPMKLQDWFSAKLGDERVRYLLVGGVNTMFGFILFTVTYLVFSNQLSYLVIFLISQFVAVAFSHFTQRHYVWRSTKEYKNELVKFSASYVLVSILNLVLLAIAVDLFAWSVLVSQYSIGIVLILGNYFTQKHWVFRNSS